MGIIRGYMYWRGHDAGGTLPPVDVLAGLLGEDAARAGVAGAAQYERAARDGVADDELLVQVPPQWVGDWETGHPLAPGYQYIWRVPRGRLSPLDGAPRSTPYRPPALPPAATGARPGFRVRRARRPARERQE